MTQINPLEINLHGPSASGERNEEFRTAKQKKMARQFKQTHLQTLYQLPKETPILSDS